MHARENNLLVMFVQSLHCFIVTKGENFRQGCFVGNNQYYNITKGALNIIAHRYIIFFEAETPSDIYCA